MFVAEAKVSCHSFDENKLLFDIYNGNQNNLCCYLKAAFSLFKASLFQILNSSSLASISLSACLILSASC